VKRAANLIISVLVLGLMAGTMVAAQEPQAPEFDLAITQIEVSPPDLNVGENLIFQVNYTNHGPEGVPDPEAANDEDQVRVYITLTLMTTDDPAETIGLPCTQAAPGAAGLKKGASNEHAFTTCNIIPPLEGSYVAKAELVTSADAPSVPPEERTYQPLVDKDASNNVAYSELLRVGPAESALPNELGRLFAGLGMFFAVMAIMAVGTEVVIDTFKVLIGVKSKVTSLDTLERFEKLMPGQLAALGVGAAEQEEFKQLTANLGRTLQDSLKPLNDLDAIKQAMSSGYYREAYEAIEKLAEEVKGGTPNDQIEKLKKKARETLLGKLDQLANENIKKALTDAIYNVTAQDAPHLLDTIAGVLKNQNWATILTEEWLTAQRDLLLQQGRGEVLRLFEKQVKPQLEGLGLNPDLVTAAQGQLELGLTAIDTRAKEATDTYVNSLKNLLDSVEARRFDTQGPIRKVWRRLRMVKHGEKFLALILGLVDTPILWLWGVPLYTLVFRVVPPAWLQNLWSPIVAGLITALIYWGILLLLARWGKSLYRGKLSEALEEAQTKNDQDAIDKIGKALAEDGLTVLQKVEYLWNYIRGQKLIDPNKFHIPPKVEEIVDTALSATTAAQIVLARTDQQRDEEGSRLRWLRAISALIGLYLAYLLQIDAAELLDAAVPGIANVINSVLRLSAEDLQKLSPIFLSDRDITAGIILTGLAASAGSTFWHDQLDRLQAAKKGAESAARVVEQARQYIGGQEQQ
jgi:hypothetical protein